MAPAWAWAGLEDKALLMHNFGGVLWPMRTRRPDAEGPPADLVPDDEDEDEEVDVVGMDGLQEAEPQGGNAEGEQHFPPHGDRALLLL